MSTNSKGAEVAAAGFSGQAQRLSLFGPPLLLEGEDPAAYDEFVGRVCAAIRPADVIDEMFIADIVALEWEVLRWRRWKWIWIRERGLEGLDEIERLDRLTAIAETRRNAALREIDRRRAVLGQTLRRSVQEIEDSEFKVIGTIPVKGKTGLDERAQD